jgi:hypothetical protein
MCGCLRGSAWRVPGVQHEQHGAAGAGRLLAIAGPFDAIDGRPVVAAGLGLACQRRLARQLVAPERAIPYWPVAPRSAGGPASVGLTAPQLMLWHCSGATIWGMVVSVAIHGAWISMGPDAVEFDSLRRLPKALCKAPEDCARAHPAPCKPLRHAVQSLLHDQTGGYSPPVFFGRSLLVDPP